VGQQNFLLGPTRTHPVKKESERHLADIGIDEDIGVELKLNLRSKAQMDRLEGQVSGYRFKRSYGNVGLGLGPHPQGPRVKVVRNDKTSMHDALYILLLEVPIIIYISFFYSNNCGKIAPANRSKKIEITNFRRRKKEKKWKKKRKS